MPNKRDLEYIALIEGAVDEIHAGVLEHVAQARADLQTGKCKDASSAARNLATVEGILLDKRKDLVAAPVELVVHNLNPQEAIRGLARDLGVFLDGTAEEIPANPAVLPKAAREIGVDPPESRLD